MIDDLLKEWQQIWDDPEGEEKRDHGPKREPGLSASCLFPLSYLCLVSSVGLPIKDKCTNDLPCVDKRMFLMAALQEIYGK
jgi:hypothetical protein